MKNKTKSASKKIRAPRASKTPAPHRSTPVASHLNSLEKSGLVRPAQSVSELEYLFRHALVQEAAYTSLVKPDRKRLHLVVGEAMEQLYPDRLEELSALLAHHFAHAGERDKAIGYARTAARRAVAGYAYDEATQHLRAALDLVGDGETLALRLTLLEELGDVHRAVGEASRALPLFQEALALWQKPDHGDSITGLRLHRKVVLAVTELRYRAGFDQFKAALPLAEEVCYRLRDMLNAMENEPPHLEMASAYTDLANYAWTCRTPPEWDEGERFARAAVTLAEKLDSPTHLSAALDALANIYYGKGLIRDHVETQRRRTALLDDPRFDNLRDRTLVFGGMGGALVIAGQFTEATPYLLEAEKTSGKIHSIPLEITALGFQSQCLFRLDRWDDMFRIGEKRSDLERRYPRELIGPTCFEIGLSATVYALRGEIEQSQAVRDQAYQIMFNAAGSSENWSRNQHY